MKKHTRIIIFLAFLLLLFLGWIWMRSKLEDKMQKSLSARYPTDSFTVRDISLTIIPPGAKGIARAAHEGLDFNVSLNYDISKKLVVKDDLYEARSRKHYSDIFKSRMEALKGDIEGYSLEMIIIGNKNLDPDSGLYPASVEIMLGRDINSVDRFLAKVKTVAQKFKDNPVEGVDAYTFRSFPGSVPLSDLPDLGLEAAWLTEPSPTPTPSPTPRPTYLAPGETLAPTTAGTSSVTTRATTEDPRKPGLKPAFAYELTILTDEFNLDEALLRNSCRSVTYTTKELRRMAERFSLDQDAVKLLNRAAERQAGKNAAETLRETTASAGN